MKNKDFVKWCDIKFVNDMNESDLLVYFIEKKTQNINTRNS